MLANYARWYTFLPPLTPFATIPEITYWDTGKDSYDKNIDSLIFPDLR